MVEAELVRGRDQASPATNPAGCCTTSTLDNRSYKDTIHQLQQDEGVVWIVLGESDTYDQTNFYFKVIRQPNGDIYLKQIDIFNSKNRAAGSAYQTNPAHDSADSLPDYHV